MGATLSSRIVPLSPTMTMSSTYTRVETLAYTLATALKCTSHSCLKAWAHLWNCALPCAGTKLSSGLIEAGDSRVACGVL